MSCQLPLSPLKDVKTSSSSPGLGPAPPPAPNSLHSSPLPKSFTILSSSKSLQEIVQEEKVRLLQSSDKFVLETLGKIEEAMEIHRKSKYNQKISSKKDGHHFDGFPYVEWKEPLQPRFEKDYGREIASGRSHPSQPTLLVSSLFDISETFILSVLKTKKYFVHKALKGKHFIIYDFHNVEKESEIQEQRVSSTVQKFLKDIADLVSSRKSRFEYDPKSMFYDYSSYFPINDKESFSNNILYSRLKEDLYSFSSIVQYKEKDGKLIVFPVGHSGEPEPNFVYQDDSMF